MSLLRTSSDFAVTKLGPGEIDSPLLPLLPESSRKEFFIEGDTRNVLETDMRIIASSLQQGKSIPSFESAGPRKKVYFDPSKVTASIVTCGGICPGLNDVIRTLVMTLSHRYGVTKILGIRNGYQGFIDKYGYEPLN